MGTENEKFRSSAGDSTYGHFGHLIDRSLALKNKVLLFEEAGKHSFSIVVPDGYELYGALETNAQLFIGSFSNSSGSGVQVSLRARTIEQDEKKSERFDLSYRLALSWDGEVLPTSYGSIDRDKMQSPPVDQYESFKGLGDTIETKIWNNYTSELNYLRTRVNLFPIVASDIGQIDLLLGAIPTEQN